MTEVAATISELGADEHAALRTLARTVFSQTFGHLYDAAPFEAFCDSVYRPGEAMDRDLADGSIQWRVARNEDGAIIGYAKLRPLVAPAAAPEPAALELQQIYVARHWHGRGAAEALMHWAVTAARAAGATELYLTVFDHNERAKRFYARHGFEDAGGFPFVLAGRVDIDRIWRKRL